MGLLQSIKNIVGSIFTLPPKEEGFAWWVEIVTQNPTCTYFFGPFDSVNEAKEYQDGYIEDLKNEGAIVFSPQVRWCKPTELTIYDEEEVKV